MFCEWGTEWVKRYWNEALKTGFKLRPTEQTSRWSDIKKKKKDSVNKTDATLNRENIKTYEKWKNECGMVLQTLKPI